VEIGTGKPKRAGRRPAFGLSGATRLVLLAALSSASACGDGSDGDGTAGAGNASGGGAGGSAGSLRGGAAGKASGGSSATAGTGGTSQADGGAGLGGSAHSGESGAAGQGGAGADGLGGGGDDAAGGSAEGGAHGGKTGVAGGAAAGGEPQGGDGGDGASGTGGTSPAGGTSGSGGTSASSGASGGGGESGQGGEGGTTTQCTGGQVVPGGEACNGQDDDCDGRIDEGLGSFSCGLGACRTTVAACVNGVLGLCIPGTPVVSTDACNGQDDDCDGAIDEDCAECVRVAPGGDDALAPSGSAPFATLQTAIDFAANAPGAPPRVCVAAGANCGDTSSYDGPATGDLTMRDGIDVFGNYRSSDWSRCSDSITRIVPLSAVGVLFPDTIVTPTILDGFAIDRFADSTTAGVTVAGAKSVLLSDLTIVGGPAATNSYGINVIDGATATVFQSEIDGGAGSVASVGIRTVGARVFVEDNCPSISVQTGRCERHTQWSTWDLYGAGLAIRGRTATGPGLSIAVLLEDAPGSRIERSRIAAGGRAHAEEATLTYGIHVAGDAERTLIRANAIGAGEHHWDPDSSPMYRREAKAAAVHFEPCGGESPWIVDNDSIVLESANGHGYAFRTIGDCHPVIDSNLEIISDGTDRGELLALACEPGAGIPSRCVVSNNSEIYGTGAVGIWDDDTLFTTGVQCLGGSCAKVTGNQIWGGRRYSPYGASRPWISTNAGLITKGLVVQGGSTLVDSNVIRAGCSGGLGTGVSATGPARISNNQIFGVTEACIVFRVIKSIGLSASGDVDVHSNFIHGGLLDGRRIGGYYFDCRIEGLGFSGPGNYRNNVIRTTTCDPAEQCSPRPATPEGLFKCSYAVRGGPTATFEHNSLEGGNALLLNGPDVFNDATGINSTPGFAGNVTACGPYSFSPSFSLSPGSTCIDAGTSTGAPAVDYQGDLRQAPPDIGPDEAL
jgi:hypothetical protein